ncbi:hypothetical protein B7P43_G04003 [Cryptotermes secundus]|uniref:Telomerase reverse transcriptase n=1 Tax=Cryptotermes secundus TaxID=105785 RepID=A0A2J7RCG0_9NEOP|nr:hypothetical protein B7P43_G04003 [Cryptotermes secundus]
MRPSIILQNDGFLEKMEKGFPEYGCYVNTKTLTNVPRECQPFCTEVTYCGYVMDTELLHITQDYARYKNQDIAHSMRLTEVKQPGKFLQKRMRLVSSLKLNALTLDELYNSREIVLSNIFHAALLQAFRFHSIVKNTFNRKNLNQRFLIQIVYESAGKIGDHVLRITNNYCRVSTVDFSTVCWIVYRAFYLRMSIVCSYYPDVLKATDWMLQCLSQRIKAEHYDEIRKLTLNMPDAFRTVK